MQYEQLRYVREEQDPSLTIETERLVVKVIDNTGLRGRMKRRKAAGERAETALEEWMQRLGH